MRMLDLKLLRDLRGMKGQTAATALVMACGLALMVIAGATHTTLETVRDGYYRNTAFADIFCELKRAPVYIESAVAGVDGVALVETGVKGAGVLDLPGFREPVSCLVNSLPAGRDRRLNAILLRSGRLPDDGGRDEAVVNEAFAKAHGFELGDSLDVTLHGARRRLRICGLAISPEHVIEIPPGGLLPDPLRFAILWMSERELSQALGLSGAFNTLAVRLSPGANAEDVKAEIDRLLLPYGGLSAFDRGRHGSARLVNDEIEQLKSLGVLFPAVFLGVAAFMTSASLTRLVKLQREQIAQMKAFGYSSLAAALHYLKFAVVPVLLGTVLGGVFGVWGAAAMIPIYQSIFNLPMLSIRLDWGSLLPAMAASALVTFLGVLGAVRHAASLPPAEAMRPEPPVDYSPSFLEKLGVHRLTSPSFRIALRNLERRPWQSFFTALGLAFAAAIPVFPGVMADGLDYLVDFQWGMSQRQDATVTFVEPLGAEALPALLRIPGVMDREPFRTVPALVRSGHAERSVAVFGMPAAQRLRRILDTKGEIVPLPVSGLLLSATLADVLGLSPGDRVRVEVREGRRPVIDAAVAGVVTDYSGLGAYMEIGALRRLLGEEGTVNGANLVVDETRWDDFWRSVKGLPALATVYAAASERESFIRTTVEMVGMQQTLYYFFSLVVAFGVIYNGARIALSERARSLATLRVLGFTRREATAILLFELGLLTFIATGPGLLLGTYLTKLLLNMANTEAVRLPFVLQSKTYIIAVLNVLFSTLCSFAAVHGKIARLDLLSALKSAE